jgi:putative oxidoreductase
MVNLTAVLPSTVLSLFRIVIGFLFACHGAASLFGVLGGAYGGGSIPATQWPNGYAAVIQLVGGSLVALGLGTRVAALICSGSMAYAYFVAHQPKGLFPLENGGVSAAMYCWGFFLLVALGPGLLSLDALISRARSGSATRPAAATATEPVAAAELA